MLPEEPYIPVQYQPVEVPVPEQSESKTILVKKNSSFSKKDFTLNKMPEQADEDLLSQYINNDSLGKNV